MKHEQPIAQIVRCTNKDCKYQTLRWVSKDDDSKRCSKCKGLVVILLREIK